MSFRYNTTKKREVLINHCPVATKHMRQFLAQNRTNPNSVQPNPSPCVNPTHILWCMRVLFVYSVLFTMYAPIRRTGTLLFPKKVLYMLGLYGTKMCRKPTLNIWPSSGYWSSILFSCRMSVGRMRPSLKSSTEQHTSIVVMQYSGLHRPILL